MTTTRKQTNRQEMEVAYEQNAALIMSQLKQIEQLLHDQPAPGSAELNWANVGSLGHAAESLQQVINFFTGEDN